MKPIQDEQSQLDTTEGDLPETEQDRREVLYVPEVASMLRISKAAVYRAIAAGVIPSLRPGRRLLVPRRAIQRLLDI
jgi:excisionase family DNA binding protein